MEHTTKDDIKERHPVWGQVIVHIFNRPINDEPTKYLGIRTEFSPRTYDRLVNIFNRLAYNWTVKDE
jgi:hypothetical protein